MQFGGLLISLSLLCQRCQQIITQPLGGQVVLRENNENILFFLFFCRCRLEERFFRDSLTIQYFHHPSPQSCDLSAHSHPLAMSSSRFHTFTYLFPPTCVVLLALSLPAAHQPPVTDPCCLQDDSVDSQSKPKMTVPPVCRDLTS